MTYNLIETSMQDARPIELYEYQRGTQFWRYTSADQNISFDSASYQAVPAMKRSNIEASTERARNALKIEAPRDWDIAEQYRTYPPSEPITLTVREFHDGDAEAVVVWVGRITSVEWEGSKATVIHEPVSSSLKRPGLRRLYQRQCPHVLYGTACGVSEEAYAINSTVQTISADGLELSMSGTGEFASQYFAGGVARLSLGSGQFERRMITISGSGLIVLGKPFAALAVGLQLRLSPGCDHTLTTCNTKFGNVANYGGFPFIPQKNPFGGDPIY